MIGTTPGVYKKVTESISDFDNGTSDRVRHAVQFDIPAPTEENIRHLYRELATLERQEGLSRSTEDRAFDEFSERWANSKRKTYREAIRLFYNIGDMTEAAASISKAV